MKQKLLLTGYLCAALSCARAQTPHFQWAKNMGGTSSCEGFSIAADLSGNTYTTGHFFGTADFDPGPGTFNMTVAGGNDVFISKLDASGNFVWAKQIGNTLSDCGNAIATDTKGNVYTTGYFAGTVDFDPGAGTYNLTATGTSNMFISKLDSAGKFVWAKTMVGSGTCIANAIAVDPLGNVYTTGPFTGTIDFDPGTATLNMTATGAKDIFISKLDTAGNFVWAKQIGGTVGSITMPNAIALDNSGNVYTTGYFYSTVDFDPGTGVSNLNAVGYNDIFVLKLDNAGNYTWAKQFGGSSYEIGLGIAVDQSDNVYTTGFFYNTVDFDPNAGTYNMTNTGTYDMFITKLDVSGNFLWAKQFGGALYAEGHSIKTDISGNVYTTGLFQGTIDFDPGSSAYNLTSVGSYDIFISKLDPAGNFVWAKGMGGAAEDYGHCIAIDASENVYTTGSFLGTVDFDPDAGVYNLTPAGSSSDIFVHKINQNPTGIINVHGTPIGNIYPNPTDGNIQIETGGTSNKNITVQVFNYLGQMLINEQTQTHRLTSFNLNQYPSGLYFIRVIGNNEILAQKSIVKK